MIHLDTGAGLLNPGVKTLGIGSANNNYNYYTDIRVFGDGIQSESVNDYDFIATLIEKYM